MYQVNVRVGRIARRQVTIGGFAPEATPSPSSVDFDSDDDDGDASSTDEMSTWHYRLSLVTKMGVVLVCESSHT